MSVLLGATEAGVLLDVAAVHHLLDEVAAVATILLAKTIVVIAIMIAAIVATAPVAQMIGEFIEISSIAMDTL